MPIELFYSNDLDILFQQFGENIYSENTHYQNPFLATNVITNNRSLNDWLRYKIVESSFGICANFNFDYFESFVWDLMQRQESIENPKKLLAKDNLQIFLYKLLNKDKAIELNIIRNYFKETNNPKRQSKKIWEISGVLASLFLEYEYQRNDFAKNWLNGKLNFENIEFEIPQKYLYRKINEGVKIGELQFETLLQHYTRFEKKSKLTNNMKPIHLFGISQISVFHQMIIKKIADIYQINIYALNPCEEEWESLEIKGKFSKNLLKNQPKNDMRLQEELEYSANSLQNDLLTTWGKTGREYFRLMNSLTDFQFYSHFKLPSYGSDTALGQIQKNILKMTNVENELKIDQDVSVQIIKAPTIFREVESVYQNIVWQLNHDKEMKLSDIAVIPVDFKNYQSVIDSVFSAGKERLYYNIIGSDKQTKQNGFVELAILSLDFILSNYSAKSAIKLLESNLIETWFKVTKDKLKLWTKWINDLKIYHCYDSLDRESNGYATTEFYTWKQAFKQLRMGLFYDFKIKKNEFDDSVDKSPYYIDEDELHEMNDLMFIFEYFFQTIKRDKKTVKTGEYWNLFFEDMFKSFSSDSENEDKQLQKIVFFNCLKLLEVESNVKGDLAQVEIPEYILKSYLEISDLSKSNQIKNILSSGVPIGDFEAFRPFNFKIVYILGLDSKAFPIEDHTNNLDLRKVKRRVGDISNYDRSSYNFLEKISLTKNKIILSWVNKDLRKDEEIDPSSVISILVDHLNKFILKENFKYIELPYWGYETFGLSNPIYGEFFYNFSEYDYNRFNVINGESVNNKMTFNHNSIESTEKATEFRFYEVLSYLRSPLQYFVTKNYGYDIEDVPLEMTTIESPNLGNYVDKNLAENIFFEYCSNLKEKSVLDSSSFYNAKIDQLIFEKKIGHEYFLGTINKSIFSIYNKLIIDGNLTNSVINSDFYYSQIVVGQKYGVASGNNLYVPHIEILIDKTTYRFSGNIQNIALNENDHVIKILYCEDPKEKFYRIGRVLSVLILLQSDNFRKYSKIEIVCPNHSYFLNYDKTSFELYLPILISKMINCTKVDKSFIDSVWNDKKVPNEKMQFVEYVKNKDESKFEKNEEEITYKIKNIEKLNIDAIGDESYDYYLEVYKYLLEIFKDVN